MNLLCKLNSYLLQEYDRGNIYGREWPQRFYNNNNILLLILMTSISAFGALTIPRWPI